MHPSPPVMLLLWHYLLSPFIIISVVILTTTMKMIPVVVGIITKASPREYRRVIRKRTDVRLGTSLVGYYAIDRNASSCNVFGIWHRSNAMVVSAPQELSLFW